MKSLRWAGPEQSIPKRPYRNSALFHFALAVLIVLVAFLTGGSVARALVVAGAFFVVATSYAWWRWHVRLARDARGQGRA